MTAVVETSGLTKRYRRVTALSDCAIAVPECEIPTDRPNQPQATGTRPRRTGGEDADGCP